MIIARIFASIVGLAITADIASAEVLPINYQGFTVWLDCDRRGPAHFHYTAYRDAGSNERSTNYERDPSIPDPMSVDFKPNIRQKTRRRIRCRSPGSGQSLRRLSGCHSTDELLDQPAAADSVNESRCLAANRIPHRMHSGRGASRSLGRRYLDQKSAPEPIRSQPRHSDTIGILESRHKDRQSTGDGVGNSQWKSVHQIPQLLAQVRLSCRAIDRHCFQCSEQGSAANALLDAT